VYCSKCGSTIADSATVCPQCGQSTHAAPIVVASGALPAAPALAYAGFWLRFLAYVIDAIVLGIFTVPILVGAAMMMGLGAAISSLPRHGDPFAEGFPAVFAGFISIFFLVALVGGWLYHALLESSEWQATTGKKVLGLAVTDLGGARISFGQASGRHFAKLISGAIPLGIGYIIAGFTEKKQAIHDMLASCLVLRRT
jgi:uncharacterized RDD family membrane protein YckC